MTLAETDDTRLDRIEAALARAGLLVGVDAFATSLNPLPPYVAPGQVIESAWGNDVIDHVVGRFATTAERDAYIPSPVRGMVCSVLAQVFIHDGTTWINYQPTAKAIFSSRPSTIACTAGTWTTLVSLTGTPYPAGKYMALGALFGGVGATAVSGSIRLVTGTGPESPWSPFQVPANVANGGGTSTVSFMYTLPTAGSITVNLQVNPTQSGLTAQIGTWAHLFYLGP